ncbi:hypothetical protein HAX54_052635, partial [Datura stramonium]|nr:hypothetical protein [Datura stramonium]
MGQVHFLLIIYGGALHYGCKVLDTTFISIKELAEAREEQVNLTEFRESLLYQGLFFNIINNVDHKFWQGFSDAALQDLKIEKSCLCVPPKPECVEARALAESIRRFDFQHHLVKSGASLVLL